MIVATAQGKIEGLDKGGVVQFRGIPFAAPPVGARRFRPPSPVAPWDGVYDATYWRPMAPQPRPMGGFLPGPENLDTSEDCLYLNVFTTGPTDTPKPVLFWIHGGGFLTGSGRDAWYNGTSFARNGVVVVTTNYRLGPLGFLHLEPTYGSELAGAANCGILDQIAALRWVQDNIAAFGGDPANVTIFGESAGAMSVATLLGTPAARGLFHKAIPQSGGTQATMSGEQAEAESASYIDKIGGDPLTMPVEELLAPTAGGLGETLAMGKAGSALLRFAPVVDGTVLPEHPLDAIKRGSTAGVPVMTGTTRDEMTLFLGQSPVFVNAPDSELAGLLDGMAPGRGEQLLDAYLAADSTRDARSALIAAATDAVFRLPAIALAEAHGTHGPAWMYLFTWESPLPQLKSCHALEIPFMWNTLSVRGTEMFAGSGPGAQALADAMHDSWLAFAKTGDPGWAEYDTTDRATRVFGPWAGGSGTGVVEDPLGAERLAWASKRRLSPSAVDQVDQVD